MPIGVILLIALEILVYLGFAEEMIRELGISKGTLVLFLAAMMLGSFIDIPISDAPLIEINVGGAIIPIILAVFIIVRIEDSSKLFKAILSIVVTGIAIFSLTKLYQFEEGHTLIDTNYLFPIVAGVVAYLTGRSRRIAFVAGTLGFVVYDLIHLFQVTLGGIPGDVSIGGAGIFDSIVISGLLAVLLAEIVGESREVLSEQEDDLFKRGLANDMEFGKLDSSVEEERGDSNEEEE
ncbi:DUF1614 domain-containing protein [Halanaerocella petrolearia]